MRIASSLLFASYFRRIAVDLELKHPRNSRPARRHATFSEFDRDVPRTKSPTISEWDGAWPTIGQAERGGGTRSLRCRGYRSSLMEAAAAAATIAVFAASCNGSKEEGEDSFCQKDLSPISTTRGGSVVSEEYCDFLPSMKLNSHQSIFGEPCARALPFCCKVLVVINGSRREQSHRRRADSPTNIAKYNIGENELDAGTLFSNFGNLSVTASYCLLLYATLTQTTTKAGFVILTV